MDIQKEREAFEAWVGSNGRSIERFSDGSYKSMTLDKEWEAWQAAKAQAVPEGFVLVEKKLIKTLHEELLDHDPDSFVVSRDICELWKQAQEPTHD